MKWLHKRFTKQELPTDICEALLQEISSMKVEGNTKELHGGREPLILDDLNKIVNSYDDWDPKKKEFASLFLFGLATGLRGHSCSGI